MEQRDALSAQHQSNDLGIDFWIEKRQVSLEELIKEMEQRDALSAQHQSNSLGVDFCIEKPMWHSRHAQRGAHGGRGVAQDSLRAASAPRPRGSLSPWQRQAEGRLAVFLRARLELTEPKLGCAVSQFRGALTGAT